MCFNTASASSINIDKVRAVMAQAIIGIGERIANQPKALYITAEAWVVLKAQLPQTSGAPAHDMTSIYGIPLHVRSMPRCAIDAGHHALMNKCKVLYIYLQDDKLTVLEINGAMISGGLYDTGND